MNKQFHNRKQNTTTAHKPLRATKSLQRKCAGGAATSREQCDSCSSKSLQPKATGGEQLAAAPPLVHEVVESPGQPLDAGTKAMFEAGFGHDFSKVRVHTDDKASQSAKEMSALAYTLGPHIAFRSGEHRPETPAGRRLLAHELAHVIQQKNAPPAETLNIGPSGTSLEREAKQAAGIGAKGMEKPAIGAGPQVIQRADENELQFLDNPAVDTVAKSVIGETSWPFLREIMRGFVGGTKSELKAGKGGAAIARMKELLTSPTAMWKFGTGYLWGAVQGLVSPIVDLWHLLKFAFVTQINAVKWLIEKGRQYFKNPASMSQQGQEIMQAIAGIQEDLGKIFQKFIDNPRQAIQELNTWLDDMMKAALGKAREAGRSIAESIFAFMELEWNAMGEKIGYAVGAVVINVLMIVFTEAIGNALSAAGRALGEAGEWVATKAVQIIRYVKVAAAKIGEMFQALKGTVLKLVQGLVSKVIELVGKIGKFFEVAEAEIGPELAAAGDAPPGAVFSKGVESPVKAPVRTSPATVDDVMGRSGGKAASKGTRVEPYEKKVDEPVKKLAEVKAARSELANQMEQRLPKGSKVDTVSIERTEAGRAQAASVTPEGAPVAMDVELRIKLPDGTTFKPDGVEFLGKRDYIFQEHKEVLTIWEKSHFNRATARRELEIMLQERADIYTKLKSSGCKGFKFTTNNETLADMIADIIGKMKGPGRQGLLAPPL
jgi:hypothetical protein